MEIVSKIENTSKEIIGYMVKHKGITQNIGKNDVIRLAKQGKIDNAVYVKGKREFIRAKSGSFDTKVIYSGKSQVVRVEDRMITSTSSKGNQIKYARDGKWIKIDSMGYEGLAEELACILMNNIKNISFVEYRTCRIKKNGNQYLGCYSDDMLKDGEALISFRKLMSRKIWSDEKLDSTMGKLNTKDRAKVIIKIIKDETGLDVLQYMTNCLCLDSIILNEDRHLNNLCVIEYSDGKMYREAPIFDNGLSLLSDLKDYGDIPIQMAMRKVKSKPINRNFKRQVIAMRELGGKPLKISYVKLQKELEQYDNLLYHQEYVIRAKTVIKHRLKALEGLAWEKV